MVQHLGPKLHRFVYGFFRKTDHQEVVELVDRVETLLARNRVASASELASYAEQIARNVADTLRLPSEWQAEVRWFVGALIDYEGVFATPSIDPREQRTTSDYWALKDELTAVKERLEKFPAITDAITELTLNTFDALVGSMPELPDDSDGAGIAVTTRRIDRVAHLGEVVERIAVAPFNDEAEKLGLFARLRKRLDSNLVIASGGNAANPEGFTRQLRMPTKYEPKTPEDLVGTYLGGTPMRALFDGEEPFVIPLWARFEHHHIVAGSGHGKTRTLEYMIDSDLDAVAQGKRSVVIIDSQGDLINKIARLRRFAPGGDLHDRICIIDPTDIEYPVSLNLFDVGQDRLKGYAPLERERLTNSILELYDFVLGTLLSAEMTQKQNVIFKYVTRLMLHIPDATIHTLRELMEKGSEVKFAQHIAKLDGSARYFFETEFASREFEQTRRQVLRRLWGILENQTFEKMFSHPRSKLDLFAEMNAGKVILINTAKDLLKESGTEIFGRFFIALIAQAAQERAVLPEKDRMPTLVYIDEAADYFDRNIGIILSQARKYRVGMVLAHQYLGQLDAKLRDAFSANTAIKFAGGFAGSEARAAAQMMGCSAELIESQPKGGFAAFVRGMTRTPVPLRFPDRSLGDQPQMSARDWDELRDAMRARYAVHYSELTPGFDSDGTDNANADLGEQGPKENDETSTFDPAEQPTGARPIEGKAGGAERSQKPSGSAGKPRSGDDPDNPDIDPSPNW
ncbi:type IV secretory system conjugative DNA transfer family protein [Oricola indica]|uniref:type IV secretory system conjugative DNA transfer family protein n=1 Tax=Oricola indica TaxID=2872591 RepID=UPI003CCBB204